jgi:hypothetical protein
MKTLFHLIIFLHATLSFGQSFDASLWVGNYSGIMHLSNLDGVQDQIMVEFEFKELKKDSSWTYSMRYKSEKLGELLKDYELIKTTGIQSEFLMNEKNGIIIDLTFLNNCFFSMFEVEGMMHTFTMCLIEGEIRIDLFGSNLKKPTYLSSVEQEEKSNENQTVSSFRPLYNQVVILKRTN